MTESSLPTGAADTPPTTAGPVVDLPIDIDQHWERLCSAPPGEGARLSVEAMRAARAMGVEAREPHGLEGRGLIRWSVPSVLEARSLSRAEAALSRWREASRLGGPLLTAVDAVESSEEWRKNLAAARWLVRTGLWKAGRLRGARRLDWALEMLLDLLNSGRQLAQAAPLVQSVQACEIEIVVWRELRQWAGARRVSTEMLERARDAVAEHCAEPVDRCEAWANELVLRQQTDGAPSPAVAAAFAALLAVGQRPPGQRPAVLAWTGDEAAQLSYDEVLAAECGLPPAGSLTVGEQDAARLAELLRAQEIFDQRDTAAAATYAFFVTAAYHARLGLYPSELSSAFTERDDAPPADPFSPEGEPLRMRRANSEQLRGAGVDNPRGRVRARSGQPLIYSVGPDGQDGDAAEIWDGRAAGGGDWVFPLPAHRPPRHWLQFDLRKAMMLMTMLCLFMAFSLSAPQQQLRAIRAISLRGGYVEYENEETIASQSGLISWLGIERFGKVISVNLDGELVDDDMMRHISQFRDLEVLQLSGATIGLRGLRAIGRMKNLSHIALTSGKFEDQSGFQYWDDLTDLTDLDVEESNFDDEGLANLPVLPRLNSLDMNNTQITGPGFRGLAQRVPNITSLTTYSSPVTDEALPEIGKMRKLDYLDLDGAKITDEGLRHLAKLNNLVTLDIQRTSLSDDALQHLRGMRNLNELRLNSTKVKGPGLVHLVRLPNLTSLRLENTPLSAASVPYLAKLSHLHSITIEGASLTRAQIRSLKLRGLTNLDVSDEVDLTELLGNIDDLNALVKQLEEMKKQRAEMGLPPIPEEPRGPQSSPFAPPPAPGPYKGDDPFGPFGFCIPGH